MSKKPFGLAAAAAMSIGVIASSANAGIGVNFIGDNNGGGASVTGSAGLIPQSNWNNVAGPGANNGAGAALVDDTGAGTGATLSWSSPNLWASGVGTNQNGILMQGYLDNSPGQDSIATVTGLPASLAGTGSTPYNVIVYMAGDTPNTTDPRGGTYTVNGVVLTGMELGPATDGVFVPAVGTTPGNYLLFTGITGTTLTIDVHPTNGGTPRAPFDGFQVLSNVPEPASLGLVGLGLTALLGRRRRGA